MDSGNWRVKRDPSDAPVGQSTPNRSFQQRRPNNGFGSSPRSPAFGGSSGQSSPMRGSPFRKPLNEPAANAAIEEGRRLYVGNLPYDTSVKDIETLFQDVDGLEGVNMSVDPMTGRNPSYCFVDLISKDLAEGVMEMYNGRMFRQRPLKVKPGIKSGTGSGRFDLRPSHKESGDTYAYDRWRKTDTKPEEHSEAAISEGRRVFLGGIPRFENQADCNTQVRDLFKDFNVQAIAKIHPFYNNRNADDLDSFSDNTTSTKHYTFVDLSTAQEAQTAIAQLDGTQAWGAPIKVQLSKSQSGRLKERQRLFVAGLPAFETQEETEAEIKTLFKDYELTSISKLFHPKDENKKSEDGNHCYAFVELKDEDATDRAQKELDWKEVFGGTVRVKSAYSAPDRGLKEKNTWRN